MIRIKLILLDEVLRRAIGEKEVTLDLPEEATVEDLLKRATVEYGSAVLEAALKPGTSILLNGQSIDFLGGLKARLSDGDRVAIIPLIVGGF